MLGIKPLEWFAACPSGLTPCSFKFTLGGCHHQLTVFPSPLPASKLCEVFGAVLHHCCLCDMLMSQKHGEITCILPFLRSTYVHVFQHCTRFFF